MSDIAVTRSPVVYSNRLGTIVELHCRHHLLRRGERHVVSWCNTINSELDVHSRPVAVSVLCISLREQFPKALLRSVDTNPFSALAGLRSTSWTFHDNETRSDSHESRDFRQLIWFAQQEQCKPQELFKTELANNGWIDTELCAMKPSWNSRSLSSFLRKKVEIIGLGISQIIASFTTDEWVQAVFFINPTSDLFKDILRELSLLQFSPRSFPRTLFFLIRWCGTVHKGLAKRCSS